MSFSCQIFNARVSARSQKVTLKKTASRAVFLFAVFLLSAAWEDASAQIGDITVTYQQLDNGDRQTTFSVSNNRGNNGYHTYMWYRLFDKDGCYGWKSYDQKRYKEVFGQFNGRNQTYTRKFTENEGKYICIDSFGVGFADEKESEQINYPLWFSSATVDMSKLTITFTEQVKTTSKPAASVFTVDVTGVDTDPTVSSYTLSGKTAVLTLSEPVSRGQTVTVSYTKPSGATVIEDSSGKDLVAFTNKAVTNVSPSPEIGDITVSYQQLANGNRQTTFSVSNNNGSYGYFPDLWYRIFDNKNDCYGSNTINQSQYGKVSVKFTGRGQTYTKSFTENEGKYICVESVGVGVADEEESEQINYPLWFSSATVDISTVTIKFSEPVKTSSKPAASVFTVDVSGMSPNPTVSSYTLTGSTAQLTLSEPVTKGQTVTVSYAKPSGANATVIEDESGKDLESFSGKTVTNNSDPSDALAIVGNDSGYFLENDNEDLVAVTKTVPAQSDLFTKVVFNKRVKHTASSDSTARPVIRYSIAGGTSTQFAVVDQSATLANGQCQPYKQSTVEFKEYLCHYTVSTGDDGAFVFEVGSATVDLFDVALGSDYIHSTSADVDADTPKVMASPRNISLSEGESGQFMVNLSFPPDGGIVTVALASDNSSVVVNPSQMTFNSSNYETEQMVTLMAVPDDDDDDVVAKVTLNPSGVNYALVESSIVTVTATENSYLTTWLAQVGGSVADQVLDAVVDRMQATNSPGLEVTLAGQPVDFSGSTTPEELVNWGGHSNSIGVEDAPGKVETMNLEEVLNFSSFNLTDTADSAGGTMGIWGGTTQSKFSHPVVSHEVDGRVMTGMFGVDYSLNDWLAGVVVSHSKAKGAFPNGGKQLDAKLTAATAYGSTMASERITFWGMAGLGNGSLSIVQSNRSTIKTDLSWSSAAAGVRGTLSEGTEKGKPRLELTSDALLAKTSTEKVTGLPANSATVRRIRVGLESSWTSQQSDGGIFTRMLDVAVRHDSGDSANGLGVHLGGGISWHSPKSGMVMDFSGRSLVAHEDESKVSNWGISFGLVLDRTPSSGFGPSFGVRHEIGEILNAQDALFATNGFSSDESKLNADRWSVESAWGFPVLNGKFSGGPVAEFGFHGDERDYSVGWQLMPELSSAPNFTFDVRAIRREKPDSTSESQVRIEGRVSW